MKTTHIAACAAALLATCSVARADASATVFFGSSVYEQEGSGAHLAELGLVGVMMSPGQSQTWTFDYTVVLHDDGLPATRTWRYCEPIGTTPVCGPTPTGYELAQVQVFGFLDGRIANPFIQFSTTGGGTFTATPGGDETYTGTLSVTEWYEGSGGLYLNTLALYAQFWVDASSGTPPVPEPAPAALLAAGLAAMAWRRRPA